MFAVFVFAAFVLLFLVFLLLILLLLVLLIFVFLFLFILLFTLQFLTPVKGRREGHREEKTTGKRETPSARMKRVFTVENKHMHSDTQTQNTHERCRTNRRRGRIKGKKTKR